MMVAMVPVRSAMVCSLVVVAVEDAVCELAHLGLGGVVLGWFEGWVWPGAEQLAQERLVVFVLAHSFSFGGGGWSQARQHGLPPLTCLVMQAISDALHQ
jgi:hypothetical protein